MIYNFSPGPAVLPSRVLEEAAVQLVDFWGSDMSILEMSHRSKAYEEVHQDALDMWRRLYAVPMEFEVIFVQGGASTQFAMVPLNLLGEGDSADYICTGSWSQKAIKEVGVLGKKCRIAGSSEEREFSYIPTPEQLDIDERARYVHITTNNTIYGTQYGPLPDTGSVRLVADISSDMLSQPLDWDRLGLVYGGAQKNAGVAGLTVVCLHRDLLKCRSTGVPTMLQYETHASTNSLYNTPPVFAVYMLNLVLHWIEARGGLSAMAAHNRHKAGLVYQVLDQYAEFYCGHAEPQARSSMNITFRLANRDLEARFCADAEGAGLVGLKGHRAVGGIRASIYNAMPVEGCQALVDFMQTFVRTKG